MELETLVSKVQSKLNSGLISSRILLDRLRLIEESSRKTAAYQDPRYAPFYYYFGRELGGETHLSRVVEIGVRLGLLSSCFFKGISSNSSIREYLGFQQQEDIFFSPRLAKANLKDNFKGDIFLYVGNFDNEEWLKKLYEKENDLILMTTTIEHDKFRYQLDKLWDSLSLDGLLVIDGVSNKAAKEDFEVFCKVINRKPVYVNTRYGTGMVQK